MSKLLKEICEKKKYEIEYLKKKCSLKSLKKLLPKKSNRGFKNLIINCNQNKKNNIIAEIKKSSPSAGEIIKNYFPENIATNYEKSGAGAISILTETYFFKGNVDHLSLINKKTNIPILRKDFIIDPYQIFESKIYKADAILLIASILSDKEIQEYIKIADDIGLDCLIEAHTKDELKRVIKIDYPIIGINNRNLDNLSVNMENTVDLINLIPKNFSVVAESGIKDNKDIQIYNKNGIHNFLIGESLLRSININNKFMELLKNDISS